MTLQMLKSEDLNMSLQNTITIFMVIRGLKSKLNIQLGKHSNTPDEWTIIETDAHSQSHNHQSIPDDNKDLFHHYCELTAEDSEFLLAKYVDDVQPSRMHAKLVQNYDKENRKFYGITTDFHNLFVKSSIKRRFGINFEESKAPRHCTAMHVFKKRRK